MVIAPESGQHGLVSARVHDPVQHDVVPARPRVPDDLVDQSDVATAEVVEVAQDGPPDRVLAHPGDATAIHAPEPERDAGLAGARIAAYDDQPHLVHPVSLEELRPLRQCPRMARSSCRRRT